MVRSIFRRSALVAYFRNVFAFSSLPYEEQMHIMSERLFVSIFYRNFFLLFSMSFSFGTPYHMPRMR